ncbi:MAG: uracil-DNA glycosylase [Burkholderiaceae bacterium]|nr:uracil-DNA glycosylase [Burkholderiaceae bacterium]
MKASSLPQQAGFPFEESQLPLSGEAGGRLIAWEPDKWGVAQGWAPTVNAFLANDAGFGLSAFVQDRLARGAVIYPPRPFRALELTPLASVKVVILGQDPYHGPGQAEGLAFSVPAGVRVPPSLRNIFKEIHRDLGHTMPAQGSLAGWAMDGVLLLNTSLTVEDGQPASHARRGWETLTDSLLAHVAASVPACAYLLWGAHAQAKAPLIEDVSAAHGRKALILKANHPSPLSALRPPLPFIGCGHFSQASKWLAEQGVSLDWRMA